MKPASSESTPVRYTDQPQSNDRISVVRLEKTVVVSNHVLPRRRRLPAGPSPLGQLVGQSPDSDAPPVRFGRPRRSVPRISESSGSDVDVPEQPRSERTTDAHSPGRHSRRKKPGIMDPLTSARPSGRFQRPKLSHAGRPPEPDVAKHQHLPEPKRHKRPPSQSFEVPFRSKVLKREADGLFSSHATDWTNGLFSSHSADQINWQNNFDPPWHSPAEIRRSSPAEMRRKDPSCEAAKANAKAAATGKPAGPSTTAVKGAGTLNTTTVKESTRSHTTAMAKQASKCEEGEDEEEKQTRSSASFYNKFAKRKPRLK